MNKFLCLCLALLQGCVAYAAAPGTAAFNSNQFATNNNRIAVKPGVLLTNAVTKGVSIDAGVTDVPATTLTASGGIITVSFTNAALYIHTLSADVDLAISDTGSATNRLIYLDLYTDGVSSVTWPAGAVLPATTNQPFLPSVGGKVSVLIERAISPGGGITNYISWTPALVGPLDLVSDTELNELTITNVLNVHGNIKGGTLVITNDVRFYNNTYVSNFFSFNGVITNANGLTIGGNIAATYAGITNVMTWALSDMTTALTTGTNKNYWYAPSVGMTIKWVRATVALKSTSGTPTFDINEAGASILSTKITIDANEFDSLDAAAAPVISDSAIAAKAKVDFDIDVAGTAAAGAQIQIGFTVP